VRYTFSSSPLFNYSEPSVKQPSTYQANIPERGLLSILDTGE